MKHLLIIALLIGQAVVALAYGKPINIKLSYNKTTILIFPAKVQPPDIGSADVLMEQVAGVDNMVRLKAGVRNFDTTNMHIITADGKLYSFVLTYSETPERFEYDYRQELAPTDPVDFDNPLRQSVQLDTVLHRLCAAHGFIHKPSAANGEVKMWVSGLYYASGLIFVKVKVKNRSYIPYVLDFTRSTIVSRKRLRQKTMQEQEIAPVAVYNPTNETAPNGSSILMFVYDKFTLSSDKEFTLHLYEKGERHLKVSVKSNLMRRAHLLTEQDWN